MIYTEQLLRIGRIAGMYYSVPGRKTSRIVVYGIGAPLPPDGGHLSEAPILLKHGVDVYVPDYLGYGRSDGRFTPMNCVRTFLSLHDAFMRGCNAVCYFDGFRTHLRYDDIHFVGASFGGAYVLLLPRFNRNITNICSIFPMVDWENIGSYQNCQEETVEGFYKAMTGDGYRYLYRGIYSLGWRKHFSGRNGLSPIDNIRYLSRARVFLGHGKKDISISYKHSAYYYHQIMRMFPDKKDQFQLKLYPHGHDAETSSRSINDYFQWIGVPKK